MTGEVKRGQIVTADRGHLRAWLVRFADCDDVAFALEGCTGWRCVAEAVHEGKVAAEVTAGQNSFFDARAIPSVAYTDPEVAWAG